MKQYEILDKHVCKINRFLEVYNSENWVMNVNEYDRNYKIEFNQPDMKLKSIVGIVQINSLKTD